MQRLQQYVCSAAAGALLLGLTPGLAAAAVDAYLQIPEIKGESHDKPGTIEISSFQWGASRGISSPTGGSADRESSAPSVSEIVVTKNQDSASPLFSKCAATGCHYPSATLYVRKAGGTQMEYLTYQLSNVMVSAYHVSSGGDRPMESITLNFTKIEMKYAPQTESGAHTGATVPNSGLPPPGPAHPPGH
jgi:type VI secretion system secreted protein Hcp